MSTRCLSMNSRFLVLLPFVVILSGCQAAWPDRTTQVDRRPVLYPDYTDTFIPPNIAPMNFVVREQGARFAVRLSGERGRPLSILSHDGKILFPPQAWHQLLRQNRGGSLRIEVAVQDGRGSWRQFQTATTGVASEDVDRYVVYRLIPPMDHLWLKIGIYQRDLEGFSEKPVIENQSFSVNSDGCVNCHTFRSNRTDRMSLEIRSPRYGRPLIVVKDGVVSKVDTTASGLSKSPASYQSWHPDGRHIAFSMNKPSPLEHTIGEHRDVWDSDSDLAVYNVDTNKVETDASIADPARRETWPSWSADGRYLYFCSSPQLPLTQFFEVKYDLMRIPYDPETGKWGTLEALVPAAKSGLSAAQPRESPDGRWLLYTLSHHGNFPIFQPTSDLYIRDMTDGAERPLTINSDWSDSWHCWSSNGRWIAFASKREGGVLARIYLSYFDREGREHRPWVMPQEDPSFYESCALTYNVPELIIEPVPITAAGLGRAISAGDHAVKAPLRDK